MSLSYEIPPEYRDRLEPVVPKDTRTDEEIIEALSQRVSVTSEKNVWSFWSTGVTRMPGWQLRNVIAWVRMCSADGWTVRIIDNEPTSPNYALNYIAAESLPAAFVNRTHEGPYVGQHSADFVRGPLLYDHGGIYLDVGCFMIREFARVGWDKLMDPESPYQIALPLIHGQFIINFYIASRKGNPFVKMWHDVFLHLWKGRNSHVGLMDHPIMQDQMHHAEAAMKNGGIGFPLTCTVREFFEYLGQVAAWQRLVQLEEVGEGISGVDYWMKHVMLLDIQREFWPAEQATAFDPALAMELLSMRRDQDVGSEKHALATKMVWDALSTASTQKISRAKNLMEGTVMLGELLDLPVNENVDAQPGTFWELLRQGPLHVRQLRTTVQTVPAAKPEHTMKKGLFEA